MQATSSADECRAIGARVAAARRRAGFTQQALASAIGVSYQQVFKYEQGINRLSSDRLAKVATALRVAIPDLLYGEADRPSVRSQDVRDLIAAYEAIERPEHRALLRQIADALVAQQRRSNGAMP